MQDPITSTDDILTVRSPEGVALQLDIAGPTTRMAAYFIDTCLVTALAAMLLFSAVLGLPLVEWFGETLGEWLEAVEGGDENALMTALAVMMVAVQLILVFHELVYFSLWEIATRGRTPGKYLMKLRVVDSNGHPIDAKAVLIRNTLRIVDSLPTSYLIGLVTMVMSQRVQRLGDHAAGSLVIRVEKPRQAEAVLLHPQTQPLPLSRAQHALMGQRELTLVRSTLRRVQQVGLTRGQPLLERAARSLVTRLSLPDTHLQDPYRFLEQILVTYEPPAED